MLRLGGGLGGQGFGEEGGQLLGEGGFRGEYEAFSGEVAYIEEPCGAGKEACPGDSGDESDAHSHFHEAADVIWVGGTYYGVGKEACRATDLLHQSLEARISAHSDKARA